MTSQPNPSVQTVDALIVGAGFSGICAAIKLLEKGFENIKLVEKAPKVGGAWYFNTYPGVACDVPSHFYCYSFEPNPNWSRIYSPGSEIQSYIEHCSEKYGVAPLIQHNTTVKSAHFNTDSQLWEATLSDGSEVHCYHLINCAGGLHTPSFPNIPGRETFAGDSMHSATWNHEVDLKGKRVAVVGTAASAIQLIPEVAKVAAHVDIYQRTPNYIMPRNDRAYTEKEKRRFKRWPLLNKLHRAKFFYKGDLLSYPLVKTKKETRYSKNATKGINGFMEAVVQDKSLHPALTPDYQLGCKRMLLSDNFFSSLNRENVSVIEDGLKSIEAKGIVTKEDVLREVDVIVYATGFDLDEHAMSIPMVGPNQVDLAQYWQEKPEAYKGVMAAGYPNIYFAMGLNTGVGTTSQVYIIEKNMDYIVQCIVKSGKKSLISPKAEVTEAYNKNIQALLQETVWAGNCMSWYKQRDDGIISTLSPFNARTFRDQRKNVNWPDFDIADRG